VRSDLLILLILYSIFTIWRFSTNFGGALGKSRKTAHPLHSTISNLSNPVGGDHRCTLTHYNNFAPQLTVTQVPTNHVVASALHIDFV